ncbi:MAG: hypothetical protein AVDCRST_MAG69-2290 [uncultured Solirubrobacteraceae bacterium]|uniref:Uncharacterized protein n=1 Tax=uncultured Solirubrobacteraceae bacterium TaxID=1162706 RepID=A0A6J4SX54_9ACTN|nr:MAG: hypothetical protein AVDCRST_MAG69-2290 [uncultured Solirubrobacteraceae bacterium]
MRWSRLDVTSDRGTADRRTSQFARSTSRRSKRPGAIGTIHRVTQPGGDPECS